MQYPIVQQLGFGETCNYFDYTAVKYVEEYNYVFLGNRQPNMSLSETKVSMHRRWVWEGWNEAESR